jgi:hypothetical protein
MKIKHYPLFDVDKITEHYSTKDGVPVQYVCTTDLKASDTPVDVYFRETPHPDFGNRYFGLYFDIVRDCVMITNADIVEELDFGLIESDNVLYYSQYHHDCKFLENGEMIDGGRKYIRSTVPAKLYKVVDGEMKQCR